MNLKKPYFSTIFFLALVSGLPLALTSSTLQAWYTVSGVSLIAIGWLTLIGQPYAFKFLWAPLLDQWSPLSYDRRRSWMLISQVLLVVFLTFMAFLNPAHQPVFLAVIALLVAVCSATFDTVFDAYRTEILPEPERGVGTSIYTIAYRIAMIFSSAIALMLAAKIGWRATYLIMAASMLGLIIATIRADRAPVTTRSSLTFLTVREAIVMPLCAFLARKNALIILLFIVLYKLPDALALSLNTTFLIRAMHFDLMTIGAISKTAGLIALLLGSALGGLLLSRMSVIRALLFFGILQALSNLLYVWLIYAGTNVSVMAAAVSGEYFCSGLSTVAFVVFLMSLCDQRYTATHYALFSAVASLGRIFIGPIAAVLVERVGWVDFYITSALIGIPALALLWCIHNADKAVETACVSD
ncbi:MAG: hypothetical protein A3E84_00240 [Gammaproteobacteria bacterium RIFCSPHIGHO2_12_FULL_42_13]|nr:MAG: hypothetical protein A3E84_00240 [Gammaproteobacteria bacterium RIFCSPHIGHO2_12_FULL_42_13]